MKPYQNVTPKYAQEMFASIEKAPDKKAALKEWGSKPPMNFLLAMNFDNRISFELPDGMPPYNRNEADSFEMYAPLSSNIRRMVLLLKSNGSVKAFKKESIFIQMLEGCCPSEADILVSAKDKSLHEIYKWLTPELVKSVFPDYVHEKSTWLDKSEQ